MKLFIKKFLGLIIIISLILLMLSFNIKKIIVNMLSETVIKNIVTNEISEVIKDIYPSLSSSDMTIIKNKIIDSNEFNNK